MITFRADQKIDLTILPIDAYGSAASAGGTVEDDGIQVRVGNPLIANVLKVGGNVVSIRATGKETGRTRLTVSGPNVSKTIRYIKVIPATGATGGSNA